VCSRVSKRVCVCSKMITNIPPGIMNNMKPSMTGVSIQRSVVAFPLRGRCNPYCCYLLPLLILAFIAFVSYNLWNENVIFSCLFIGNFLVLLLIKKFLVLGALVASGSIPASIAFYTLNYNFQAARITAITVYSLVLFITGTIVTFYMCNMFNCCDSRYTPILLNVDSNIYHISIKQYFFGFSLNESSIFLYRSESSSLLDFFFR
jgi:hypothetical protein